MQNTPTGCGADLLTILGFPKHDPKARSVNNFPVARCGPKQYERFVLPAKAEFETYEVFL